MIDKCQESGTLGQSACGGGHIDPYEPGLGDDPKAIQHGTWCATPRTGRIAYASLLTMGSEGPDHYIKQDKKTLPHVLERRDHSNSAISSPGNRPQPLYLSRVPWGLGTF